VDIIPKPPLDRFPFSVHLPSRLPFKVVTKEYINETV
jgi:hypothetical protein